MSNRLFNMFKGRVRHQLGLMFNRRKTAMQEWTLRNPLMYLVLIPLLLISPHRTDLCQLSMKNQPFSTATTWVHFWSKHKPRPTIYKRLINNSKRPETLRSRPSVHIRIFLREPARSPLGLKLALSVTHIPFNSYRRRTTSEEIEWWWFRCLIPSTAIAIADKKLSANPTESHHGRWVQLWQQFWCQRWQPFCA